MIVCRIIPSPLGKILLSSDGENLTGLWFEGQKHFPDCKGWQEEDIPIFGRAEDWLRRYFAGQRPDPNELPLSPTGTAFQQKVWRQLLAIPWGSVTTYGAIAKAIGCKSAQAVGNAVGRNPISILIPCHRVVGSDGSLTGYASGLEKKEALLKLEGSI